MKTLKIMRELTQHNSVYEVISFINELSINPTYENITNEVSLEVNQSNEYILYYSIFESEQERLLSINDNRPYYANLNINLNTALDYTKLNFEFSEPDVLTVNEGVITVVGAGVTTLTISSLDNSGLIMTYNFNVLSVLVESFEINDMITLYTNGDISQPSSISVIPQNILPVYAVNKIIFNYK